MEEGLSPEADSPSNEGKGSLFGSNCSISKSFPTLDIITTVEYSINGDYLATGDRNGRVTILKLDMDNKAKVCFVQYDWNYELDFSCVFISLKEQSRKLAPLFSVSKPRTRIRLFEECWIGRKN